MVMGNDDYRDYAPPHPESESVVTLSELVLAIPFVLGDKSLWDLGSNTTCLSLLYLPGVIC